MNERMEQYLSVLNEEQKQAVVHEGSPLLILAGAGSGKTRVITTKIAYLISEKDVNPYSILSVTFTKKAANEMKERAVAMEENASKAQIRTFHSFGSWFLRKYAEAAGLENNFTVYDDDDMAVLLKDAVPSLAKKELKTAVHQISLCKDYCLGPEDDLSFIGSEFEINEIYAKYQKALRATGNVDFGDLIMLPVTLMDSEPVIAAEIHSRFSVIMVDEYQDSNIAQYKMLQKLSGVEEGTGTYVCVVGDDDQSIYHFRGAEVQNILTFPEKFPGTQIIRLERNYRSTSRILDAASIVVGKNSDRLGKNLIADRGDGKSPVLAFLPDQTSETQFCADLIQKSHKDGRYSDWAVLYRMNAQSLGFEKEFLHRHIPYVVVGFLKFYEREEIKDTIAYLSLCANPRDAVSFRRVVNKPVRGIGEKTQSSILQEALILKDDGSIEYNDLVNQTKKMSDGFSKKAKEGAQAFSKLFDVLRENMTSGKNLSDFIQRVITDTGLDEYHRAGDKVEGTQRVANLQELVNSAVPYECSAQGLTDFLDSINLDRSLALSDEEKDDAVTLITLHNTKGLEYKKVIITGLEEGVFPRQDKQGAELEEERRLFYVGITRAQDELYITSVAKRWLYGNLQYVRPSVFLRESSDAFKVIGSVPFGFSVKKKNPFGDFGKRIPDPAGTDKTSQEKIIASGRWGEKSEIAAAWPKGTKIYHDDYGYGIISRNYMNAGEYVIDVQFENGCVKKFIPEYQSKSLQKIKD